VIAALPAGAAVSADEAIVPHLAHRRAVWEFPLVNDARYVVIDRALYLPGGPEAGGANRLTALPVLGFCLVRSEEGVELWAKDGACGSPPSSR
jgi:hypothetical protein